MSNKFNWADPQTWPKVLNELLDLLVSCTPRAAHQGQMPYGFKASIARIAMKLIGEGPYLKRNMLIELGVDYLSLTQLACIAIGVYSDRLNGNEIDMRMQYAADMASQPCKFVKHVNTIRINDVISMGVDVSEQFIITEAQVDMFIAIGMTSRQPRIIDHDKLESYKIIIEGCVIRTKSINQSPQS